LRVALGGGADIARVEPRSAEASLVTVESAYTGVSPAVRTAVALDVALGSGVSLLVIAAAESDPTRTRWAFDDHGTHREVLTPLLVRPSLALGLVSAP
jgi:hypothetical protein